MEEWVIQLIQSVGIPMAILVGFAWAVWQVMRWLAREIVIPLRDRVMSKVLDVLDRMDKTLVLLDDHIERVAEALGRIEAASRATADRIRDEHTLCRSEHCGLQEGLDALREEFRLGQRQQQKDGGK